MIPTVLLALLQPPALPLIGDTVWVAREIEAPAGSLLRPLPWDPGEDILLLGPPEAAARAGGWTLRYPLVFWRPGTHRLAVPGPLVIRPDGMTDTLGTQTELVVIGSLLPAGRLDTIPPRPAVGLVAAGRRSWLPVMVLTFLAVLVALPLHWWWRRTGPPATRPRPGTRPAVLPPREMLESWAAAGELRAAADGWMAWLEAAPPSTEGDRLLLALREARFESGDRDTLGALCREASRR
ncbi:MAG TPA: hypothetical protein VMK53_11080 [Gemmatimonadales bacterium]|nr:hypothetical protein [Gemmatimonadales bacterium]